MDQCGQSQTAFPRTLPAEICPRSWASMTCGCRKHGRRRRNLPGTPESRAFAIALLVCRQTPPGAPLQRGSSVRTTGLPFCLGWANETWTGIWHGAPNRVLIELTYPGRSDNENHFHELLEGVPRPPLHPGAGKPVFVIYRPTKLPRPADFVEHWQTLAAKNGLEGIHFVAHVSPHDPFDYLANGFAGVIPPNTLRVTRGF